MIDVLVRVVQRRRRHTRKEEHREDAERFGPSATSRNRNSRTSSAGRSRRRRRSCPTAKPGAATWRSSRELPAIRSRRPGGSGCQPGGGCQPAGGCGRPGGVANVTGGHPSGRSAGSLPFDCTLVQSIPHRQRTHRRLMPASQKSDYRPKTRGTPRRGATRDTPNSDGRPAGPARRSVGRLASKTPPHFRTRRATAAHQQSVLRIDAEVVAMVVERVDVGPQE